MKLLIKNGRVVHPVTNAVLIQDLLVEDGKVSLLERGLEGEADQVCQTLLASLMVYFVQLQKEYPENITVMEV